MILDLKGLFSGRVKSQDINIELDMSDTEYYGNFPVKEPVKVIGSVFNKADVVNLKLNVAYDYSAPCDRCSVETVSRCVFELERQLATSIEGEQSDTIITVPDMKLDVDELIFSEVFLSFPTKHLCKETCKGICLKCGKNLNEGDCSCDHREVDPRLAKLLELLED